MFGGSKRKDNLCDMSPKSPMHTVTTHFTGQDKLTSFRTSWAAELNMTNSAQPYSPKVQSLPTERIRCRLHLEKMAGANLVWPAPTSQTLCPASRSLPRRHRWVFALLVTYSQAFRGLIQLTRQKDPEVKGDHLLGP